MEKTNTILIIDDDADDRSLFIDAVGEISKSLHCIAANDGEEALLLLDTAGAKLPDYIFLDLNMPRLNGKQCLCEIKKRPHLFHIPVIIYSTTRRVEDVEETKKMGAVHFLTKPILFSDICHEIKGVLQKTWDSTVS
jgi:CheY-like chemotaxis protein